MHTPKDERTLDELKKLGYERGDIGLRTIAIWLFWFFAFTVIAGIATGGIYWGIGRLYNLDLRPKTHTEERTKFPAEPRLQDDVRVKTDIYDLRAHEDEILVLGKNGGIPIDQEIDMQARALASSGKLEVGEKQTTPPTPPTSGHVPILEEDASGGHH
jgi:hypothetical protein